MLQSQKLESKYYKPQVKSLMVHKRLYNLIPVTYIIAKKRRSEKEESERNRTSFHSQEKGKMWYKLLVNKESFMLGITETGLGCYLMQIESHSRKDCIQGIVETFEIQIKRTSRFIWPEVAIMLKKEISKKPHLMPCVSFFNWRKLQWLMWNSLMAILWIVTILWHCLPKL